MIEETAPEEIFTTEDFTDEHRMIAKTASDFTEGQVVPRIPELEEQEEGLMQELLRQAGELGLLAAEIPEEYGGLGLDKISSLIITENIAKGGSFPIAHGAHTGLAIAPVVFFGSEEQKAKYLPHLASGEKIGAYALTEPAAGSDALNTKTTAALSPDGQFYVLNGSKQFITNAGYADLIITYAKVDGEQFTAFIIDRERDVVSLGNEEKKMGIRGSSTRSIILEDTKVPVANLLGEIGKGHLVAFNILNMGRFRLGAGCLGASKVALRDAISYSRDRVQFGKSICNFGLIKQKLAEMAIRIYVLESMMYRTGGLVEEVLKDADTKKGSELVKRVEEYAIECSINKIFGSEVLDFVVDESLQIFGGYGYSQEYPVERYYRDSRINRIFEGTNEINRLLIPGMLMKRAMKGDLPLVSAAKKLSDELLTLLPAVDMDERAKVAMAKKAAILLAGISGQKYQEKLRDEQEILGILSDICIEIYAMESALLRALKYPDNTATKLKITKVYMNDAVERIAHLGRILLATMEKGDVLRTQLAALRKLIRYEPYDTISARRSISDMAVEIGGYPF